MADSLDELKSQLSREILGKGGVHGLGVSRSKNALRVYIHPADAKEQQVTLEKIRAAAGPFQVIVETEQAPMIAIPATGG
jgi:hypothetical protein